MCNFQSFIHNPHIFCSSHVNNYLHVLWSGYGSCLSERLEANKNICDRILRLKACSRLLRAHKYQHEYLFPNKDCLVCEVSADNKSLLTEVTAFSAAIVSRNSLEIQPRVITRRKTLKQEICEKISFQLF